MKKQSKSMLEKYNEFSEKKKKINAEKKQHLKKIEDLNKEKLKLKLNNYNSQKELIQKKMNQFVNGPSSY